MCLHVLPERKHLPHHVPSWVPQGARYFITINHEQRPSEELCQDETPRTLLDSALHYEAIDRWYLWLALIMPDHLHAVMTFEQDRPMKTTVEAWKGYQAKFHGVDWQRGFFDHRLRNDDEFVEKAHYIRMNPVRAGLVATPDEWPHVVDRTGLPL